MRTGTKTWANLIFITLLLSSGTATAQLKQWLPRTVEDPRISGPQIDTRLLRTPKQVADLIANRGQKSLASQVGQGGYVDETARVQRLTRSRGDQVGPDSGRNTIPFWSDSFQYQGLEFSYKVVGTDPTKGSATTIVPTSIIPLRFVFADGTVFDASTDIVDGQTAVTGMINSPVFQNYNFSFGGTPVGNTQYGDAFQRANFWNSVSSRSRDYHVLLGQPNVLPTQTIVVPADMGEFLIDPVTSRRYGAVDFYFIRSQLEALFEPLNIRTDSLPIFCSGLVLPGGGGFHNAAPRGAGVQTYIVSMYDFEGSHVAIPDASVLSHEIIEWINDPFVDNYTPGWNFVGSTALQCAFSEPSLSNILEVADPLERRVETLVGLPGTTYHVVDATFIDFFTRRSNSRSINGQYYLFEHGAPSTECVGVVTLKSERFIDFPGSILTEAESINNDDDVAGYYLDQNNAAHAFVFNGRSYSTIEPPGSLESLAFKITDLGQIYGYFFDGATTHGFSYQNGSFQRFDYPGATNTRVLSGNSDGTVVGWYKDSQTIKHGFVFKNGRYRSFDAPFGVNTNLFFINDRNVLTGSSYGGALTDLEYGFIYDRSGFALENVPGAAATEPYVINRAGMTGGFFFNADGFGTGYVNVFGQFHMTAQNIDGNNDRNEFVGLDFNDQGKLVGFVGTLPFANENGGGR